MILPRPANTLPLVSDKPKRLISLYPAVTLHSFYFSPLFFINCIALFSPKLKVIIKSNFTLWNKHFSKLNICLKQKYNFLLFLVSIVWTDFVQEFKKGFPGRIISEDKFRLGVIHALIIVSLQVNINYWMDRADAGLKTSWHVCKHLLKYLHFCLRIRNNVKIEKKIWLTGFENCSASLGASVLVWELMVINSSGHFNVDQVSMFYKCRYNYFNLYL